jgi:hypothetical protein
VTAQLKTSLSTAAFNRATRTELLAHLAQLLHPDPDPFETSEEWRRAHHADISNLSSAEVE